MKFDWHTLILFPEFAHARATAQQSPRDFHVAFLEKLTKPWQIRVRASLYTGVQLIMRKSSEHSEAGPQKDRRQVGELRSEAVRPGPEQSAVGLATGPTSQETWEPGCTWSWGTRRESVQLGFDAWDSSPLRGVIKIFKSLQA